MNRKMVCLWSAFLITLYISQFGCAPKGDENNQATGKSQPGDSTTVHGATSSNNTNHSNEDAVPVEVMSVKEGEISSYLLLSSNLETEKMADVYSRVQGLVEKLFVEEGETVQKGQVLMALEANEYTLAEQRARVSYLKQKNTFERAKTMHEKKLLSKEEFEQAKFNAESEEITWKEAKLNLDYTRLTAPISGIVGERLCRPGDRIQPTDKLFSIINTEEMITVVHIPEKEIERVVKDQEAFISSNHLKDQQFQGWVKRVSPAVDPQSGTFKVTVGVKNTDNKLRPGMFVNVHIITDTHKNAVLIPKTAIVYENENMNVFVVRDSLAYKIKLNAGFQDHSFVEALSEIQAGEKVIVVGQAGLKDQTKVKIAGERENY